MRRIAALLSISLICVLLNFCLWFYHSRSVHESVNFAKNVFAAKNIDFSYKDIYFESFKFWNLRTIIEGVKISESSTSYIEIEKLELESKPLELLITLKPRGAVRYNSDFMAVEGPKTLAFDGDTPPAIEFRMDSFLELLSNGLFNSSARNPLGNIAQVSYADNGVTIIDDTTKLPYIFSKPTTAGFKHFSEKYESGFYITFDSLGVSYSPEALDKNKPNFAVLSKLIEIGENKLAIKFKFRHYFSDEHLEYFKKAKEDKKDVSEIKSDMFEVSVIKFEFSNDALNFNLNGNYHKKNGFSSLPYFDFIAYFKNYPHTIEVYSALFNAASEYTTTITGLKTKNVFDQNTQASLAAFLDSLAGNKKPDLELHIIRTELYPNIKVNEKPIFNVISDLNKIFPNLMPVAENQPQKQ